MLGFRLFYYALRRWFKDFFPLIGVSFIPCLCIYATILATNALSSYGSPSPLQAIGWILWLSVAFGFAISWGAISWHKVSLLREGTSLIPPFKGRIFVKYTSRMITLFVAIGVITACYIYLAGYMMTELTVVVRFGLMASVVLIAFSLFYYMTSIYLMLRLGVGLCGIATGAPLTIRETWDMSRGHNLTFCLIAFSLFLILVAMIFVSVILDPVSGWALSPIIWVFVTLWLAVSTELYSYFRAQSDVTEIFG